MKRHKKIFPLQTRARGSLKRRPPSRTHRKKAASDLDPTDTPQKALSAALPNDYEHNVIAADTSIREPSQVTERLQDPLVEKNKMKMLLSAEQKGNDVFAPDIKTNTSCESSDSAKGSVEPVGVSPYEKNKKVAVLDSKDILEVPKCALDVSKSKSATQAKSHSLFDVSDSDEDLFGETKQKKSARNPLSSGSTKIPKVTRTKYKSHALFEDDDDGK